MEEEEEVSDKMEDRRYCKNRRIKSTRRILIIRKKDEEDWKKRD